jgi:hypothetical protein
MLHGPNSRWGTWAGGTPHRASCRRMRNGRDSTARALSTAAFQDKPQSGPRRTPRLPSPRRTCTAGAPRHNAHGASSQTGTGSAHPSSRSPPSQGHSGTRRRRSNRGLSSLRGRGVLSSRCLPIDPRTSTPPQSTHRAHCTRRSRPRPRRRRRRPRSHRRRARMVRPRAVHNARPPIRDSIDTWRMVRAVG